jgi:hypothetical protein
MDIYVGRITECFVYIPLDLPDHSYADRKHFIIDGGGRADGALKSQIYIKNTVGGTASLYVDLTVQFLEINGNSGKFNPAAPGAQAASAAPIDIDPGVHLGLYAEGENIVRATATEIAPGIRVPTGTVNSSLNVYGSGSIDAYGAEYCAGIGGAFHEQYGAITVYSGTVRAFGMGGAGIGTGYEPDSNSSENIYILGGTVYAAQNAAPTIFVGNAAGIGAGLTQNTVSANYIPGVVINGGTVYADVRASTLSVYGGASLTAVGTANPIYCYSSFSIYGQNYDTGKVSTVTTDNDINAASAAISGTGTLELTAGATLTVKNGLKIYGGTVLGDGNLVTTDGTGGAIDIADVDGDGMTWHEDPERSLVNAGNIRSARTVSIRNYTTVVNVSGEISAASGFLTIDSGEVTAGVLKSIASINITGGRVRAYNIGTSECDVNITDGAVSAANAFYAVMMTVSDAAVVYADTVLPPPSSDSWDYIPEPLPEWGVADYGIDVMNLLVGNGTAVTVPAYAPIISAGNIRVTNLLSLGYGALTAAGSLNVRTLNAYRGNMTVLGDTYVSNGFTVYGGSLNINSPTGTRPVSKDGVDLYKNTVTVGEGETLLRDTLLTGGEIDRITLSAPDYTAYNVDGVRTDGDGRVYLWLESFADRLTPIKLYGEGGSATGYIRNAVRQPHDGNVWTLDGVLPTVKVYFSDTDRNAGTGTVYLVFSEPMENIGESNAFRFGAAQMQSDSIQAVYLAGTEFKGWTENYTVAEYAFAFEDPDESDDLWFNKAYDLNLYVYGIDWFDDGLSPATDVMFCDAAGNEIDPIDMYSEADPAPSYIYAPSLSVKQGAQSKVYDGNPIAVSVNTSDESTFNGNDYIEIDNYLERSFRYTFEGIGDTVYARTDVPPTEAGNYRITVTYERHEKVSGSVVLRYHGEIVSAEFGILPADGSGSVTIDGWDFGGNAAPPVPVSTNGTDNVAYYYQGVNGTDYNISTVPPTHGGNYTVTATFAATLNYKAVTSVPYPFTVRRIDGDGSVTLGNWAYGESPNAPDSMSVTNGTANVVYYYTGRGDTGYTESTFAPTNVGTYTVRAVFAQTRDYESAEAYADFEITLGTGVGSVTVDDIWYYGDAPKTPVPVSETNFGGSVFYSYTNAIGTVMFEAPTAIGTYTLTATFAANPYYKQATAAAEFEIVKAIGSASVTAEGYGYGDAPTAPTAKYVGGVASGASYLYTGRNGTVYSSETAPTAIGEYTLTVTYQETSTSTAATAFADFAVTKGAGSVSVAISAWAYRSDGNAPVLSSETHDIGTATVYYTGRNGTVYSGTEKPSKSGEYTATATFAENEFFYEAVAATDFAITPQDNFGGLGIASGGVAGLALLGAGGFSIFWFAVKKKSFADLRGLIFEKK